MYEKHLDMGTGRYYFVATGTGESSWDTPHGEFKLTKPPAERTAGFQLEKALAVQQHKSLKEERALLIAIRQEDFEAEMADKVCRVRRFSFEILQPNGSPPQVLRRPSGVLKLLKLPT